MKILFSPIGTTDPVRNCRDGACLHILRHYHPDKVVLYFTAEMEQRERNTHMYTRGIDHVQPGCPVVPIYSGIVDAHLYDAYLHHLPGHVLQLHQDYPDAEILLNLSSGTPQIKVILAIMSTEYAWCRGIQVASPERRSNVNNIPVQDKEDVEEMLLCNEDDESDAPNRCEEPHLEVLRFYREKYEIMSLINQYEYMGAWAFCKGSHTVSEQTKKLIHFAMYRADLQTKAAQQIMRKYQGKQLFLFEKEGESLTEYLLTMQIHKEKKQYASFMVQISPFLYELFMTYAKMNLKMPLFDYREKVAGRRLLRRQTLLQKPQGPELIAYLDNVWPQPFYDSELSFILLYQVFCFAEQFDGAKDAEKHHEFMADSLMVSTNPYMDKLRKLRNNTAHEIINVTEETIKKRTGLTPDDIMKSFWHLLSVLYGSGVNRQRMAYKRLNQWIEESLLTNM